MFLRTATARIPLLRRASLSVWSRDRQTIFSLELPRPQIRYVSHTSALFKDKKVKEETPEQKVDPKVVMETIENELSKIQGLDELKIQLRKWLKGMLLDERRRALSLQIGPRRMPQLAFLGNPGTGKTMIARMLGKLLHMVGILKKDKVVEVQRTDLVAQYIGQTGPKTREKIKKAKGGILFVDEAYRLVPVDTTRDFGPEALEEIMSFMDKEKLVVIFAGYTEPMNRVISSNEGIRRRISNIFHFDDFTCEDLANIMHLKVPNTNEKSPFCGFKLDSRSTSVEKVAALIERGTTAELRGKMNGGLVDQMLVKARENLDSRTDVECTDENAMVTITLQDLAVGLRLLRAEEKSRNHDQMAGEFLEEEEEEEAPEIEIDNGLRDEEKATRAIIEEEAEARKALEIDNGLPDKENATRAGVEEEAEAHKALEIDNGLPDKENATRAGVEEEAEALKAFEIDNENATPLIDSSGANLDLEVEYVPEPNSEPAVALDLHSEVVDLSIK